MTSSTSLVERWLELDKNDVTRREIQELAANGNEEELKKRLTNHIEFGTAGLRGRMEAGFSRMNDLTIIQASQGLCEYVLEKVPDAKDLGVVIGHDHRHNSDRWARLTAQAFVSRGMKAYLHRGLVHTPLVPFSVGKLKAACGVMITASHNPKNDNGYKVYWQNAVQIIEPHDEGIAAAIKANLEPSAEAWNVDNLFDSPLCVDKTEEMIESYFEQLSVLSRSRSTNGQTDIKFVFTAMHGVGYRFGVRAAEVYGFKPFVVVGAQKEPDPEFPTVSFPNPEEKGALDLALKEADAKGADYVLAVDPDADRFAAAEKQPDGRWVQFTGDQLGTLFAAWVLEGYQGSGKPIDKLAMVASTVSSKMVETMAKAEGFQFAECLTGFKWIGNTALNLVAEKGYDVAFGYEEAIGFMLGSRVRDKDGIAAMMTFAEMVVGLKARGINASEQLEALYDKYGYHQTRNSYFVCKDPAVIQKIFERLRRWPSPCHTAGSPSNASYPSSIGALDITAIRDLTPGQAYDSERRAEGPELPVTTGEMITFKFKEKESGVEVVMTLRTSGTEPKIKYYIEGRGNQREKVTGYLGEIVDQLRTSWMDAEKWGLTEP